MPKKYSNLDRTIKAEKSRDVAEKRGAKSRAKASKADPFKPGKDAARKAAVARKGATRNDAPVKYLSRLGVKAEGAVPTSIRAGEWAQRSAEHRAKNRAKARKNPNGRIAKALAKKGYNAAAMAKQAEDKFARGRTRPAPAKKKPTARGGGSRMR